MGKKHITRWVCDLCGAHHDGGGDRPKGWENVRLPTMTRPKSKRTKPRMAMKRLLACSACLKKLLSVAERTSS